MAVRGTPDDYKPEPDSIREGQPDFDDIASGKLATGDPQEGTYPPRDHPIAVHAHGVTAEEQLEGESLDEKLARELPDFGDPRGPEHRDVIEGGSDEVEELDFER